MGMPVPVYYTADMVRALPDDGKRYETVHGELLVSPAPREMHQRVSGRLFLELGLYLREHRVGALYASPADISWGPHILVQPDLFVVDLEEARSGAWSRMRTLLLAIEVLSPSTTRYDRFTKRRLYQEVGIPLYWVVDADARYVEVWTPDATFPEIERETLRWTPAGAREPFELEVPPLFGAL
jgi:Uma2 family endonuclease